ncbi:MAG: IS4 family transposase [Proteobacteria bacterium]|nr:IS4 family transposase [Pseudomonadota bacterium]
MNSGRTVFSQVMDFLPMQEYRKCVARYSGNNKVRKFSCMDQYLCMAFAQFTYRESLRDIEACLRVMGSKLYHAGFRGKISRSTLADANEKRDWRIYADFAQALIQIARPLYANEDLGLEFDNTVYALDATTIDLCLTVFPWAHFRKTKAAVKLHTLLDLRGSIPTFIHISDGKLHGVNVLDILLPEPGTFYVMDRGYVDFERLYALALAGAFFIVRAKSNTRFQRRYSHEVDRSTGVLCDQTVVLTGIKTSEDYLQPLRRVKFRDVEFNKTFNFLTNNFMIPSLAVADLYHYRWQVELFFKWIKQHLRIKAFFGTSENAVKTQIWIAVSVYVLVAILKKRINIDASLYTILQILSVTLFEKTPIWRALSQFDYKLKEDTTNNQLNLFNY